MKIAAGGGIVIAEHGNGITGADHALGAFDDGNRIGVIAHQIAQQGKVLCALVAGVLQAGVQRLAVGVDV